MKEWAVDSGQWTVGVVGFGLFITFQMSYETVDETANLIALLNYWLKFACRYIMQSFSNNELCFHLSERTMGNRKKPGKFFARISAFAFCYI